jgi:single-strand DNA-binding protein
MNRWDGVGRLTRDPEVKSTSDGSVHTLFTIAIDRDYKTRDGARRADFIPCVAWGKLAMTIEDYATKGRLVSVGGELQSRTFETNGQRRTVYEVRVNDFQFEDARPPARATISEQRNDARR